MKLTDERHYVSNSFRGYSLQATPKQINWRAVSDPELEIIDLYF